MLFSDIHGDPEICFSIDTIELTIKCWKIAMQKLYLMREQKSRPEKIAQIWMKKPLKKQKLGEINPEFHRN